MRPCLPIDSLIGISSGMNPALDNDVSIMWFLFAVVVALATFCCTVCGSKFAAFEFSLVRFVCVVGSLFSNLTIVLPSGRFCVIQCDYMCELLLL